MRRRVYRVDWAEAAERDLVGIVGYLGRQKPLEDVLLERLVRES